MFKTDRDGNKWYREMFMVIISQKGQSDRDVREVKKIKDAKGRWYSEQMVAYQAEQVLSHLSGAFPEVAWRAVRVEGNRWNFISERKKENERSAPGVSQIASDRPEAVLADGASHNSSSENGQAEQSEPESSERREV